ncbi:Interferon-induced protein with tetratricopeptide repeats 1 [Dissostichus eleginoides]|uniref:Interferon-induced protein with tetratricopeptide repeats 1 n=1 Tax=Dissostichus eleginoides TaxID=100907 RepID=A0AAD9CAE5_DISEL|nr:Interferon-induced protein with tetratricopeptide repeats 1 [Dissostichus eleginoides]
MMSAAQTLVSRLKALQCHFTWDLGLSRSLLLRCRDNLLDIGTENGNPWLGHIYNLRGFIQYRLGFSEDAQSFFNKAKQAFCKIRSADEGPWLVVNYGNLAWLHHALGNQAKSEDYLSKVDALNKKYTSSSQTELHPEIYSEKAYTLMTFNGDINLVADYFQRAIEMQPDMVEWNSWHVLALLYASKHSRTGLEDDIFEKMRIAQEQDPENLYLAAHYLCQCAMRGESIEDEAQEALKNHPDERYLKRRAALCYYEKRFICSDSPPKKSMLNRAVSLHQEQYPVNRKWYQNSNLVTAVDGSSRASCAAQTLVSRLEALQCHFTWDLGLSRSLLFRCRDNLEDIGTKNGNPWLGHIYNLRGFIQYKLGFSGDAQSFFNKAKQAFCKIRSADEGPWLVVNYGNLAWLHHHLGDQAESEAYLSKVDALNKKYTSSSHEELHPEIYAEKAYTLLALKGDINLVADYFQRAIEMQPDMVEWNSWHVLALMYASKHSSKGLEDDIFEKMRIAKEQDPENLYLAAHYLDQRAQRGEIIEDEAQEALKNHPDERYLKRCAALCYEGRLIFSDSPPKKSMIDRAVSLHQEQYPVNRKWYQNSNLVTAVDGSSRASCAAQTLVSRLKALQCHFTWDLGLSRSLLFRCRDNLEDIGTENGNPWLGHIYNLRGFIQYKLGFSGDAQSFFNKAKQAFCKIRSADEGPWLVVNYGNLAWLHHSLGNQAESEAYLSKVDALNKKYQSPSQEELHPEIYAEKAYTLLALKGDINLVADYFQRAIEMQPDMVEWNSWHVLALMYASKHSSKGLEDDIFEKMRIAKEQDPENLYLAAHYLDQRAQRGEIIEDEARELATKVLRSPVSSYSGLKPLLRVYRKYISVDESIDLAEEALKNHPDERYLTRCADLCYEGRLIFSDSPPKKSMIDRAVSLHQEVIALYPHSSLMRKIDLAKIYTLSHDGQGKAEQIYQELLERDLELEEKQMLYNYYAKYLNFQKQDGNMSIRYHMKAAVIPQQSFFRKNSIKVLEKIRDRGRDRMCGDIREFLANLQEP